MKQKSISMTDALKLLENGEPHTLRLWKIGTKDKSGSGEILTYKDAVFSSRHVLGGTHTVMIKTSLSLRKFRDICLFEVDGLRIYI